MFVPGLASGGVGVVVVVGLAAAGFTFPAFGPFDAFFLVAYGFFISAVLAIARIDTSPLSWRRTIIDAAVGGAAVLVLVWEVALNRLVAPTLGVSTLERLIAMTYPVADAALIVCLMFVALRRSHYRFDPRLLLFGFGIGFQVLADISFLVQALGRDFSEVEPVFPLFLLSAVCYVAGADLLDRQPEYREFADRSKPSLLAAGAPYVLVFAVIVTHVVQVDRLLPETGDERVVLFGLAVIGLLVIVRQILAIQENRTVLERQRRQLVGSVSHELRTPLTAMVGFLELVSDETLELEEQERQEMLDTVTDEARHMARIVTDLVMIARGGTSVMEITPELVDLGSVCSVVAHMQSAPVHVSFELGDKSWATVDDGRVVHALVNLLANAHRYGNGAILLVLAPFPGGVVFEVHDDGPGIPTRYVDSIWNPFERGSHRLDAQNPGLGVGLAVVRLVAEAHSGRADYRRSERLGGACFSLVLPTELIRAPEGADRVLSATLRDGMVSVG